MVDITDVSEVRETHHVDELNAFLDAGWTLINTAGGKWQDTEEPFFKYSVGWARVGKPIKPKY